MKHIVCLAIAFILLATVSCKKSAETKKTSPSAIDHPVKESELTTVRLTKQAVAHLGIQTGTVEDRSVHSNRKYSGEVISVPGQSMTLMAPVSGTILGISNGRLLPAGSPVRKGQPLYRLMILPSEKDLLSAQEEVALKKVQVDVATEKLKRAEALLKDKAGSVRAKQEAEAELANVTAALRVAEARVELMKGGSGASVSDKLSTLNIESSVDGFIQKVYVSPSQVVSANAMVMDVAAVSPLWIRVPVYAGEFNRFDRTASASVSSLSDFNGGEQSVKARPVDGPKTADPLLTSADLYYEIDNHGGQFRPGQRVSVTLPYSQEGVSKVVPFSAILYDIEGGTWLYERRLDTVFVRKRVEVSSVENGYALLRRGPGSGTVVVTVGAAELFGTEFGGAK